MSRAPIFFFCAFSPAGVVQIRLKAPSAELTPKLGWIPAMVVKAMSLRGDWDLRGKVLHLLDEVIVPAGET